MLPGFRFLFAAVTLSMSLLVFGLGAAALLRTAHEEVASNPSWRAAPEVRFVQPADATAPVLAMLRVDMPAAENAQDDTPAADGPAEQAVTPTPAGSEKMAALKPEDSAPTESAKPETANAEIPVVENPTAGEAAPASVEMPTPASETRVATTATEEAASLENQPVPAQPEQPGTQVSPDAEIAATKIATLGGPPVSIETPPAKVGDAKPDQNAVKKHQQAKPAVQHRRIAAHARMAVQAPPLQPANPFGQPAPAIRTR